MKAFIEGKVVPSDDPLANVTTPPYPDETLTPTNLKSIGKFRRPSSGQSSMGHCTDKEVYVLSATVTRSARSNFVVMCVGAFLKAGNLAYKIVSTFTTATS